MKHINAYLQVWFEKLYKSAFRLVYAHDGHVTRVIFIFLNIWWLVVTLAPNFMNRYNPFNTGAVTVITTVICIIGVLNGFFLLLFRENETFIGINYAVTMLLLLTGAVSSIITSSVNAGFGAFMALAGLCALSYVRHVVKSSNSFSAMMRKAHIDVEQVDRKISALAVDTAGITISGGEK